MRELPLKGQPTGCARRARPDRDDRPACRRRGRGPSKGCWPGRRRSTLCAVRAVKWSIAFAVAAAFLTAPAAVYASGEVRLVASVNGVNLAGATGSHPVRITPGRPTTVAFVVRNGTSVPVPVASVNLEGRVAGLTFFSFDTLVRFDVPPGQSKSLSYVLDTTSLKGQATGLMPSSLTLSAPSGQLIAGQPFVSYVSGSLISVYGLFGLGILVLTALGLMEVLLALAHGKLLVNRWRRGIRFMVPSLGIGGILVFSLSAFGKWLPSNGHWLSILAIFAAVGFVIGYLTPTPPAPGEEAEDEEDEGQMDHPGVGTAPVSEIQA